MLILLTLIKILDLDKFQLFSLVKISTIIFFLLFFIFLLLLSIILLSLIISTNISKYLANFIEIVTNIKVNNLTILLTSLSY